MSPHPSAAIGHRTVTKDAVATFAGLTGDYARIHLDHHLGAASPYGGGFAHGLLSASWALGALTLYAPERVGAGDPRAFVSGLAVRFAAVVGFGDTLSLEWTDDAGEPGRTAFSCINQEGTVVTAGSLQVSQGCPRQDAAEPLWPSGRPESLSPASTFHAEDLLERGPRGASRVRTMTEADVVGFTNFTADLNPLYLDTPFAQSALFGGRVVPPMLCFCLGFSSWLRELLRIPAGGGAQTAGHLGDRWELVAPVLVGDTLEVRHKPLSVRRTRSQPAKGVMTYGLQLVNQREEVVQQGEVDMMLDMRDPQ